MRRHQLKCKAEFWRGVDYFKKVRRGGEGRVTGGGGRVAGGGWRVKGGGEVGGVADQAEPTSEVDNSAACGAPPPPASRGSSATRGEEELGDRSQALSLEPEREGHDRDVTFQEMECGGVAAESGVLGAAACGPPPPPASGGRSTASGEAKLAVDRYRGMSKRDKRKWRGGRRWTSAKPNAG